MIERTAVRPRAARVSRPLAAQAIGSLVTGLAFSTASIALPRIAADFALDIATVAWIPLVQSILMPGLLLPFGWLGDRAGLRRVFLWGTLIFAAGSLLSALSPAFVPLLLTRIVTTVGAAMTTAVGGAMLFNVLPADQRGQALGTSATFHYVGLAIGPAVGGLALAVWDWPGAFALAVPLLLGVAWLVWRWIPVRAAAAEPRAFDWPGSVFISLALGGLLFALTRGADWGWTSPAVIGLAMLGLAAAIAFVVRQTMASAPLLDLRLLRDPVVAASSLSVTFAFLGAWTPPFLLPFLLVDVRALSAAEAGVLLGVMPAATMLVAPLAGALADRTSPRLLTVVGTSGVSSGLLLIGVVPPDGPLLLTGAGLLLIGVGIGLFSTPNNVAILNRVPADQRGTVSAFVGTMRTIGIGGSVAVAGAIYAGRIATLSPSLDATDARATAIGATFVAVAAISAMAIVSSALARSPR